jgi:subtilisin family serine protease
MATPHVAGTAALYLSVHPSATPQQVAAAIVNNATNNKVSNPGTGSPNKLLFSKVNKYN